MNQILDHVGIRVADYDLSLKFYRETLGVIGIELLADWTYGTQRVGGFGRQHPTFWISSGRRTPAETHLAFVAESRAQVQVFHTVAMSMGGRDNGAPGLRPHYHPDYYAAFVFDPDGNNVEAVCHVAE